MSLRMPPGLVRRADGGSRQRRTPLLFDATLYSGCVQWCRADDIDPVDRRQIYLVSSWTDRTGAHTYTPATTSKPLYHPLAWQGRAALVLSRDVLLSTALPATGAGAHSLLAVVSHIDQTNARQILMQFGSGASLAASGFGVEPSGLLILMMGNSQTNTSTSLSFGERPDVLVLTYDGTTARLYANGSEAGSLTATLVIPASPASRLRLGSFLSGVTTAPADAAYYEVAAYNRALTSAEVTEINALLQAQYATGR